MAKPELDKVRQVLEAALKNLEEAGQSETASERSAVLADRSVTSEGRRAEVPIVLILAGELKTNSDETPRPSPVSLDDSSQPGKVTSVVSGLNEKKVSHPGLERFTIEADSHPSAPKACFMEPGRTCVNSGACEMRGF